MWSSYATLVHDSLTVPLCFLYHSPHPVTRCFLLFYTNLQRCAMAPKAGRRLLDALLFVEQAFEAPSINAKAFIEAEVFTLNGFPIVDKAIPHVTWHSLLVSRFCCTLTSTPLTTEHPPTCRVSLLLHCRRSGWSNSPVDTADSHSLQAAHTLATFSRLMQSKISGGYEQPNTR